MSGSRSSCSTSTQPTTWARSEEVLACGIDGDLELETLGTLKVTNHFYQVARPRIPSRAEHAHQAACGSFRDETEFLEPDRHVNVVAQNRFAVSRISGQERLHPFAKQFLPVSAVLPHAGLHRLLELARERHCHVSCDLSFLRRRPEILRKVIGATGFEPVSAPPKQTTDPWRHHASFSLSGSKCA